VDPTRTYIPNLSKLNRTIYGGVIAISICDLMTLILCHMLGCALR